MFRTGCKHCRRVMPRVSIRHKVNQEQIDMKNDYLKTMLDKGVEFFNTSDATYVAHTDQFGKRNIVRLESKTGRSCVQALLYKLCDKATLKTQTMDEFIQQLIAHARFECPLRCLSLRVAKTDKGIEIDLNNQTGQCVLVSRDGWKVTKPESYFYRPDSLEALPVPQKGGALGLFKKHLNVASDNDLLLMVGFMVMCFRPQGPYPLLILQGEQGCAKSTTTAMIKALTDPAKGAKRGMMGSERDIYVAAQNNHLLSFDNLSGLKHDHSDTFCRIATGGAFSIRKNYTDDDEKLFELCRPVMMNGIEDIATRPDLADRSVIISLPVIRGQYRTEQAVWTGFNSDKAQLFGFLLDCVVSALQYEDSIRLDEMPRMADFVVWCSAAEKAMGVDQGAFKAAVERNQDEAILNALSLNPIVLALRVFLTQESQNQWEGTMSDLLQKLNDVYVNKYGMPNTWPKNPMALSHQLNRLKPQLNKIGIGYETLQRSGDMRLKQLKKLPGFTPYRFEGDGNDADDGGFDHFFDPPESIIKAVQ